MLSNLKNVGFLLLFAVVAQQGIAQETFPVNGVADKRTGTYAFTHATIVKDANVTIADATMLIREGKIISVGKKVSIPEDAVVIDCTGKYLYPSFIDLYTDYGMPGIKKPNGPFNWNAPTQFTSDTKGAYGWNQAIRSYVHAIDSFTGSESSAKPLMEAGFGTVLTHQKDGIARGTSALVSLGVMPDNKKIYKAEAASQFSFNKGTSNQSYPNSLMGSIALLRQTFLDAQWYKNSGKEEGINLSLKAWNDNLALPLVFEANDKWNNLRADRIGDEFGVQFILKGGGDEYERINEMKNTKASFILPINFPMAMEVDDPNDARFVNLTNLKKWEMAPGNPAAMAKAGIEFSLTSADLKSMKDFWPNLRKAIYNGLSEQKALDALTRVPATMLKVYDETGSLDEGKWANFLVTNGPLFDERNVILQNWTKGEKNVIKDDEAVALKGVYTLNISTINENKTYTLNVKSATAADVIGKDTIAAKFSFDGTMVKINFNDGKKAKKGFRLSGINNQNYWQGNGIDSSGQAVLWAANFVKATEAEKDTSKKKYTPIEAKLTYPNMPYGWESLPKQESMLIKNATVWTSEGDGILQNTDVLVQNGKITAVGKNLNASGAKIIDGTGKHLTPGIIDEHSHIATASVNEGGQSVTSEVRIADNLDPDDINIYRQLAGGVTTSHILHGSANTIGGQTQLIKLRWGANDDQLKFKGADGFIKFALGENVKRTTASSNNRFPDTRMGVQQVQMDAFTRAKDYENKLKGTEAKSVRRDLELDALVEIMNKKRFITCHSYVASEILETMKMAEQFGFTINTFTHILEGYKVADKMKAHGAAASTFSDWWAYKLEVQDAIPYNALLMHNVGLNVAINSDDPEMARRLNQEAAKSVKYGGMSEAEALKMVTINPATMLHINQQTGSIKTGKDADLVLWSDNPLSIYAKVEKTIVDGIVYFELEKDRQLRAEILKERTRIIQKMLDEKKSGAPTTPAKPSMRVVMSCDEDHKHGLLDGDEQ